MVNYARKDEWGGVAYLDEIVLCLAIKILPFEWSFPVIITDIEEYCASNNSEWYCCQQHQ